MTSPRGQKPTFTVGGTPPPSPGPSPRTHVENSQMYVEPVKEPWKVRAGRYIYNKENKTFCDKSCSSWARTFLYGLMFIALLLLYAVILLFISFAIIKYFDKNGILEYYDEILTPPKYIGLTGRPLQLNSHPMIWYKADEPADYSMYINDIEEFLKERKSGMGKMGPCGTKPYGFGDRPCVILKVNKQKDWVAKPLTPSSNETKSAPEQVKKWIATDSKKYWLYCHGYNNYDKEHIGKIHYYPDPPGIDSSLFPLKIESESPFIAIQVNGFTMGVSLAIECSFWYEGGTSNIAFMLYVSPKGKILRNLSRW